LGAPSRSALKRLLVSLIADEIEILRRRAVDPATQLSWMDETRIDEEGLGFDSLGRLDLAARLNSFFHLHEVGIEDYLLLAPTLGGWLDIVEKSLGLRFEHISFKTSGSTGAPKAVTHKTALLDEEVAALATLLEGTQRVVTLVPAHHIYGFLFTIRLPEALDVPVIDARILPPGRLARALEPGDLVIATPHLYGYLLRAGMRFAEGVMGVSSTAPLPSSLRAELAQAGLASLHEIYGSSETAGLGHRAASDAPFALFPHWRKIDADRVMRAGLDAPVTIPDRVDWAGTAAIRPIGRRDGAVKIGGINVFPAQIAEALKAHPLVKDCAVRALDPDGDETRRRLSAFVVPEGGAGEEADLLAALLRFCAQTMKAAERPADIRFGAELPRNAMGKLAGW
jgi:long-chain acyl-CoA synthetase